MRSTRLLLSQWRYGGSFRVEEGVFCNRHLRSRGAVAPHASSVDPVHEWLERANILGTEFRVWKHTQDGDVLPTVFNRAKGQRTCLFSPALNVAPPLSSDNKISQLYNVVGFVPRADDDTIVITAYSEDLADLHAFKFYEEQVPQVLDTYFTSVSVNGGIMPYPRLFSRKSVKVFGFGILYLESSTDGRPPFNPDANTPTNTDERHSDWLDYVLAEENVPLVISTSYGDNEQTGKGILHEFICSSYWLTSVYA
ncbi:hypothetical protein EDB86DRAFT_3071259 [Lactarius hatsudake]|nr:hypothetical protein EDB86DRAFT_3071259 [Lactarius hatsudake]